MKHLGYAQPQSPEWHARRRQSVGASEVAAILGLGAYGSPAQVWAAKVGESAFAGNEATRIGTAMERSILDAAGAALGAPVLDGAPLGTLAADETDRLTCHLDGWIGSHPMAGIGGDVMLIGGSLCCPEAPLDERLIPVEAKWTASVDAPTLYDDLAAWLEAGGDMPAHLLYSQVGGYWCQVQAQLAVTGAPYGYLVALLGDRAALCLSLGLPLPDGSLRALRVPRDDAFTGALLAAVPAFWARHVEARVCPPVTEADLEPLRRARRDTVTPEVDAPDLADLADEIEATKARIKAATDADEKRLRDLHAQVEGRILGAGCDRLRCGAWTIDRVRRSRKASEASEFFVTTYRKGK
jgi:hypothetical protein